MTTFEVRIRLFHDKIVIINQIVTDGSAYTFIILALNDVPKLLGLSSFYFSIMFEQLGTSTLMHKYHIMNVAKIIYLLQAISNFV